MMARKNQYAENPHKPGTMAAAGWDANRSLENLGRVLAEEQPVKSIVRLPPKLQAWLARKGL